MRKRSSYKPRPIIRDPLGYVLSGVQMLTDKDEENVMVRLKNLTALDGLARGEATVHDLNILAGASNMAMALSRKYGGDWKEELLAAANAIEAIQNRRLKWGKVQATRPEVEAIALLMEIHHQQLDASCVIDIEKAVLVAQRGVAKLEAA